MTARAMVASFPMLLQAIGHYGSDRKEVLEIQGEIYGAEPKPASQRIRQHQTWCLSFSLLDIVIEDETGTMLDRPLLTALCDVHSSVVSGYHLGFGEPNLPMTVAALRHAILRKQDPLEDGLSGDWAVYGVPKILLVDASTLWTSSKFAPLHHLLEKLGINLVQTKAPSEGAIIDRFFKGFSSRSNLSH